MKLITSLANDEKSRALATPRRVSTTPSQDGHLVPMLDQALGQTLGIGRQTGPVGIVVCENRENLHGSVATSDDRLPSSTAAASARSCLSESPS